MTQTTKEVSIPEFLTEAFESVNTDKWDGFEAHLATGFDADTVTKARSAALIKYEETHQLEIRPSGNFTLRPVQG